MEIEIDFAFGKGPKAEGDTHTYPYFVSVTRRDRSVLAKDVSTIEVTFPKGADIVRRTEKVDGIVIPRATRDRVGHQLRGDRRVRPDARAAGLQPVGQALHDQSRGN